MRLTLVIASLRCGGGAERAMAILASAWAERGEDVTLITFDCDGAPSHPLHPRVQRQNLDRVASSKNLLQGLRRNWSRIRALRRAIRASRPDIVASLIDQTNVLTLIAARGFGVPVVIGEQIDPSRYDIGPIWTLLRRWLYPRADALVCPARGSLARFQSMIKVRGRVIANPFELPRQRARLDASRSNGHTVVAMGRLVYQKGFDLLLDAFSTIAAKHPDWSLTVLGEGPLREELEARTAALGLSQRVRWPGYLNDPVPLLGAADMFVFSSRFEGFGLALAEAMACGLPVVSFDCPEGPGEIIRNGVDGVLVPAEDTGALAAALDRLMSNPEERRRLAARAPEVAVRFSLERILGMWQEPFDELLHR